MRKPVVDCYIALPLAVGDAVEVLFEGEGYTTTVTKANEFKFETKKGVELFWTDTWRKPEGAPV